MIVGRGLGRNKTLMLTRIIDALITRRQRRRLSLRDPKLVNWIHSDSLLFYYGNLHSQRGQDGILAEIFRRLDIAKGTFVEFGAWDGAYLSNCRFLYERGWSGVFIESTSARFAKLLERYSDDPSITCVNAAIGTTPGVTLADVLAQRNINVNDITFVSIDVDGPDLDVFLAMGMSPPVVLVEGGFSFSPFMTVPVPAEVAAKNVQQPIAVICSAAVKNDYVPVCFYQDLYLVRSDLSAKFRKPDYVTLYKEAFYFMPLDYRAELLRVRELSAVIRQYETHFFGQFCVDPLVYQ